MSPSINPTENPASKPIDPAVRPIPEGMRSVTPHLVCAGASEAIEFYKDAFGAVELRRLQTPEGRILNALLRIGDSAIMLVDEQPDCGSRGPRALKGSPVTIHLYVSDADAIFERAVRSGAKVTLPLDDRFWGDRYGRLEDPFGHEWSVATHLRDMTAEEMQAGATQMCG